VIQFTDKLTGTAAPLNGRWKFNFNAVDRWFEEDAPIYVHPKDPFKRIDILPSTRRVQVFDRKDGKQLADAQSSMHLYETGLPVRYYLPLTSVDASLLRPSSTKTQCPYKGEAEYYSIEIPGGGVLKDTVWYYDRPILESAKIESEVFPIWIQIILLLPLSIMIGANTKSPTGLLCFYSEKVEIKVDGQWLPKS
jgi:uncharacterized protein (DUF427 family)